MIFTFGSRGMHPEEWDNVIKAVGVKKHINFHDNKYWWFLANHWPDKIKQTISEHGHPTMTLGSSMGAFAALYYQDILQAKTIIAFNPQMTTVPQELIDMGHEKNVQWGTNIRDALGTTAGSQVPHYSSGKVYIYFGFGQNDQPHRQLAIDKGYEVIHVPCKSHNTAGHFKDTKELIPLIKEIYINSNG